MEHTLQQNWQRAQEQVRAAAATAGRPAGSVKIIAVSKYVDAPTTWQLAQAGATELGESRPQVLWDKHAYFSAQPSPPSVQWHMIGHLQRNKAARTVPLIDWLHSLDSLRLAETVNAEALKCGKRLKVLLEVNVTQDSTKTGLPAGATSELVARLLDMNGLELRGLMAMSTDGASLDQARDEFETVRELRDTLAEQFGGRCQLSELSMGMSGDFVPAIAAGATMVRLGSMLWEK